MEIPKNFPEVLTEAVKESFDYFSELDETLVEIRLKENISGSFMQAQPVFRSMFPNRKRRYKIKISRYLIVEDEVMKISEIPKDVLIGWIGHELGHIMDYLPRTNFNMIVFGIRYFFSRKFMSNAEKSADIFAIEKGLSAYLIKAKNYILEHTSLPEKYKAKIRKYYLSPEEVMMHLEGDLDVAG